MPLPTGRIKALWVMGTNPAVSLPRADAVREALAKLDLLVVSENVASNDTVRYAHVRLPAAAWGEKDGTVTNSERRISRQRAFLPLAGEARPDWWMLSEVARRLGCGEAFAYRSAAEIFDEHARLSGFENDGERAFDISGAAGLERARPTTASSPSSGRVARRTWRRASACSPTAASSRQDRKARFVAIAPPRARRDRVSDDWPFVLNTGRMRDQWHTMTRTGLSPRLSEHIAEPFVEIHPDDAGAPRPGAGHAGAGRDDARRGHRCACSSTAGSSRARCSCRSTGRPRTARAGRIGALVQPATDPVLRPARGQGDAGAHRARMPCRTSASLLSRRPLQPRRPQPTGRAARATFGHVLNFALDAPSRRLAARGCARRCPRASG